jgi:hypothetical protein
LYNDYEQLAANNVFGYQPIGRLERLINLEDWQMEGIICPKCDEHNHVTARSCKRCDHELKTVGITKLPANGPNNNIDNPVDVKIEEKTTKDEMPLSTFVSRFLLGFFGWFLSISLFLGVILVIMESMGPEAIILVPFTFVPILATILAVVLAFLIPKYRARREPLRKKGMTSGIIAAYVINFVINLILNMGSDPLAIVGSILGWPFYMIWLENLFGF